MKESFGKTEQVIPTGAYPSLIPAKGLVHALSEIQFISRGEKQAGDYDPKMLVTLTVLYSFIWEGFYVTLYPMLFSFISIPVAVGILNQWIPAFGTYEHGILDKILILLLSFSPGMLKVMFIAYIIDKCYLGKTTKTIVKWFTLYSIIPTVLSLAILGFFIYQLFYFYILSDQHIQAFMTYLTKNFPKHYGFIQSLNHIIYAFKYALPKSSIIYLGYAIFETLILLITYFHADYKTKKYRKFLTRWGLRKEITNISEEEY